MFDDLDGATARVIKIGERAKIVVSTRIAELGSIRFSIAHELGHLICQHFVKRRAMERACVPLSTTDGSNVEREASIFATELLMPLSMVAPWCKVAPRTLDPIKSIASSFQTSLLASALRYIELTSERCAVVYSEVGRVRWVKKSPSFTAWIPRGRCLAPASAASDYFSQGTLEESTRIVPATAWLARSAENEESPIYEHTVPIPAIGAAFSFLWLNENGAPAQRSTSR
ncbi:MAG: ImmA/IrrE family metallo-endopeptidase [Kofleriaceae bacterium]